MITTASTVRGTRAVVSWPWPVRVERGRAEPKPQARHYRGLRRAARALVGTLFAVRVDGAERLPPPPYVLACNHHNGFDPFVITAAAPEAPGITWFGPREECGSPAARALVRFLGCVIPYSARPGQLREAARTVGSVLAARGVVGIFPEGRVAFRESRLLRTRPGAAAFAVEHGVPVVPCAIIGSSALWVGRELTVRFGDPVLPPAADRDGGDAPAARVAALQQRIEAAIGALLPPLEPVLPRAPHAWLTDLLNGPDDVVRRRRTFGGWTDASERWSTELIGATA
jgi:1-acyl-sn-glycerol-3-phosphate acyltransferase